MANLFGLNYESTILDLHKQRDALMQAVHQIDQAISSLEAIRRLVGGASDAEEVVSPIATKPAENQTKQGRISIRLPESVRQEAIDSVEAISGDVSQPLVLQSIIERFPGTEEIAKKKQWGARISGALRQLEEKGILIKVKESFSNNPAIYRKVSEMPQVNVEWVQDFLNKSS